MPCGRPKKRSGACRLREGGGTVPRKTVCVLQGVIPMSTLERNFDMSTSKKPLYIDIPVKLAEVKAAFSIGALMFEGDLPAAIFHIQLIENDIDGWSAKAQVIAVFHTNPGTFTLNNNAYNAERNIATGTPYKGLVADLIKRGVPIELCVATGNIDKLGK